jgi:hypothetical protein
MIAITTSNSINVNARGCRAVARDDWGRIDAFKGALLKRRDKWNRGRFRQGRR